MNGDETSELQQTGSPVVEIPLHPRDYGYLRLQAHMRGMTTQAYAERLFLEALDEIQP